MGGSGEKATLGIKNDKSTHLYHRGSWKWTLFSKGKQFQQPCLCTDEQDCGPARDGSRHSRGKTDDWCFSVMWVGEIFMQNSKKKRNPSFYHSFFHKEPSWAGGWQTWRQSCTRITWRWRVHFWAVRWARHSQAWLLWRIMFPLGKNTR